MLGTVKFAINYFKQEKNQSRCTGREKQKPHGIDFHGWALNGKFFFDSEVTN